MKFSIFILLCVLLCSGCTKKNTLNTSNKKSISVVCANFPCFDAVRAVSKNISDISNSVLVRPGSEVHSFDPTPQDIISIQNSDLFVYIGGESDEWVEKILSGSILKNELKLIDFVETLEEFENPNEEDEHIWTSPKNEKLIVNAVASAVCEILNNKNLKEYVPLVLQNTNEYCEQIDLVELRTKKIISSANEKFIVMADRFPFAYFADYYDLDFLAAFSGCSTAVEASTFVISKLISTTKEKNLPAVFYIELGNHKIADSVAESSGVPAILLQSVQNVTKSDFENGETWVTLMERNANALERGLR